MIPAVLLLGLGLALVVAEVLFPSFGVLSVLATAAIAGAVVLAFRESTDTGVNFLIATALLVPATIVLGLRVFPKSPIGKHLVSSGLSFDASAATDERDVALVGARGRVEAPCRPAGMARVGGRRVDVVTRGEWLERDTEVEVVEVVGNRVVVVRIDSEDPSPQARP